MQKAPPPDIAAFPFPITGGNGYRISIIIICKKPLKYASPKKIILRNKIRQIV